MNNVIEMKAFAEDYLYTAYRKSRETHKMHGALNYMLCVAFDRMTASGLEVTKRDVVVLIESWTMAQGTHAGRSEPLWDTTKVPF